MAARYVARERIFTGLSPSLLQSTAVFAADDLTLDECQTLALSVQKCFNDIHDVDEAESWYFELGPSAQEDPVAFINLKSDWDGRKGEIETYREASGNSWQADVFWFYRIAGEYADIIREMREHETPTVYLQCDGGGGYETFDRVDSLTWNEIDTLETVLGSQLYDMGLMMRVISDWHAERQPAIYIQARMGWTDFEDAVKEERADETLFAANGNCYLCMEEIKALRAKPVIHGSGDEDEGDEVGDDQSVLKQNCQSSSAAPVSASEELRTSYRDPDNYWRNVWLYEQRKVGKTNAAILADLAKRATDFAPIDTENALRSAIETIALHHHWPVLKGKAGRPRSKDSGILAD